MNQNLSTILALPAVAAFLVLVSPVLAAEYPGVERPKQAEMVQEDYVCKTRLEPNYAWVSVHPASNSIVVKFGPHDPKLYIINKLGLGIRGGINQFGQSEPYWFIQFINFGDGYTFAHDNYKFYIVGSGWYYDCAPDIDQHLDPEQLANEPTPNDASAWESSLVRHLQRYKRYPSEALSRSEEGIVLLSFSIDRNGHVLAHHIARSSGHPDLDNEVMDMLMRAEPLPAFPANMSQAQLDLTIPIRFSMH